MAAKKKLRDTTPADRAAQKSRDAKQYREGIKQDVEGVATRAKVMTGKKASKLSNEKVEKANREYDNMDYREGKRGSAVGRKLQGKRI